jgi:hypothetical protein
MTVTLTGAVEALREQLAIANARADRAEQRVVDKEAAIAYLHHRLDDLLRMLVERRPWWRRWLC